MFEGHREEIEDVTFSLDGRRVMTTSGDSDESKAIVWDVASGRRLAAHEREYALHPEANFSEDGKLVIAAEDESAIVWNSTTGKTLANLRGHTNSFLQLAVSLDGGCLLSTSYEDDRVIAWQPASGK